MLIRIKQPFPASARVGSRYSCLLFEKTYTPGVLNFLLFLFIFYFLCGDGVYVLNL